MNPLPRPNQYLHPWHEPVKPAPAATLLLLRDGPLGLEVLMTRRSLKASFVPGAYVFPGGGIEAPDAANHALAAKRATQSPEQLTHAICALRESFEELGILLARNADGSAVSATQLAELDRRSSLFEQCAQRGLHLATDQVFVLARWITDRDLPKRFDVSFLVAPMPDGQTAVADDSEQFDPVWVRPQEALERHEKGNFFMIFPTLRTLQRLGAYQSVAQALEACAGEKPLWTSCPRGGWMAGAQPRFMESDPPFGELELTCPDGQMSHTLDWKYDEAVPLLKCVVRITANNPHFMTGPGTNSYLVGQKETGYICIDPGPADKHHIQSLFEAAGGDIRAIVCTHSHSDHAPGAKPLQLLCGGVPPILGLPSRSTAGPHSQFTPDRALEDGEELKLSATTSQGPITHTLRVIHTPGHAANHLCLLLVEDGLLFSGDHVLNGSTTIVNPPDGNMTDYLDSLDRLARVCESAGARFILPAHGWVIGSAVQAIAHLKAHRLARESKVAAAMRALPGGTLDEWVSSVYDDVPRAIWPQAKRSMLAHVERLRALGLAQ